MTLQANSIIGKIEHFLLSNPALTEPSATYKPYLLA